MIKSSYDRTGIFGASDVQKMLMGFNTKGFQQFWFEKTGEVERERSFSKYITAGNLLEEPVIQCIAETEGITLYPSTVPFPDLYHHKLIVNLDALTLGEKETVNYEIKCCGYESVFFGAVVMDKWYRKQVQVQMLASGIRHSKLCYYGVLPHEYEPDFLIAPEIDYNRIVQHYIAYDDEWLEEVYVPRLIELSEFMEKHVYPWGEQL